jgi:large conductance mechanosensitive channel
MTDPDPMDRLENVVRGGVRRLDLSGFRSFILRGNVVDLAVGIVIGAAFTTIVQSLVKDFITPLVGIPLGTTTKDFQHRHWTLGHSKFFYGDFLKSLLSFILVGLVVYYFVVRPVNHLMERFKPEAAAETRSCPECCSSIPVDAKRCAFCTSEVQPAASQDIHT